MGDDQHRRPHGAKELFQPLDGFQVQVVGRLVEQEEVGVLEEESGQGQAPALPAAEGPRFELLLQGLQAHAVEHLGDPAVVGVSVQALVLMLGLAVTLQHRRRALRGGGRQAGLQLGQLGPQSHHVRPAV